MPELGTPGSVGAWGGQPPWATRHSDTGSPSMRRPSRGGRRPAGSSRQTLDRYSLRGGRRPSDVLPHGTATSGGFRPPDRAHPAPRRARPWKNPPFQDPPDGPPPAADPRRPGHRPRAGTGPWSRWPPSSIASGRRSTNDSGRRWRKAGPSGHRRHRRRRRRRRRPRAPPASGPGACSPAGRVDPPAGTGRGGARGPGNRAAWGACEGAAAPTDARSDAGDWEVPPFGRSHQTLVTGPSSNE